MSGQDVVINRWFMFVLMTSLFGTNIPGCCCALQARSGSCHITPPLVTGFGFILGEKMTQVAEYVKWAVRHLGMPLFLLPPPPVFLGLLTRPAVPWCAGARCVHPSPHHVSTLSAFGGLSFPGRLLFFRGKIPGGVENAVSHRGHRDHSQKQRAFPSVLSRSSGETQLPERSHLCVVGFPAWTPWAACRGGPMRCYPSKAAVQKISCI